MELQVNQKFENRDAIKRLLGGNPQMGITRSSVVKAILLFVNEDELYSDGFFQKDGHEYLLYTGIGRIGHQDSIKNKSYNLNMAILTHRTNQEALLVFAKKNANYIFKGCFELLETHQSIQLDDLQVLRRVFVFHLQKVSDNYIA